MATDTNIEIKQSRYEEIRRRLTRFRNGLNISDREIIESLAEEIEYYRNKIKHLDEIIDKHRKRTIESKEKLLETEDEKCIVTRWYTDGVLMKEEIKPYVKVEIPYSNSDIV